MTEATVRDVAYYGDWSEVVTDLANGHPCPSMCRMTSATAAPPKRGDKVWVTWAAIEFLVLTE